MTARDALLQRLDVVAARLAAAAASRTASGGLTEPDAKTGEQWEAGQVWAHIAEFIPYWIDQTHRVVDEYNGEAVPFGRISSDPHRIAAIERDREQPITVLWSDAHGGIEALRHLLTQLDTRAWAARGVHPTRGVMDLERILDEFLIHHLEEHADQLDGLAHNG